MLWIILGIIVSYLVGSIPTAYIFGRALKGIDIREFGSGNVGATNALRVLGKGAGITVLLLDMLKGAIPVVFVADFIFAKYPASVFPHDLLRMSFGITSMLGHNWTIFLNFKGGKGVATTFGILVGLAFKVPGLFVILALVSFIWLAVFMLTKIVSISSVFCSLSFPLLVYLFKPRFGFSGGFALMSVLIALFIVIRHKSNLKRVLAGKEPRLSFKKSS